MNKIREPVRVVWIWPVLIGIVLALTPWYLPPGTIGPIICGFPQWAFFSLLLTLALSFFLTYVIKHYWDMTSLEKTNGDGGENK